MTEGLTSRRDSQKDAERGALLNLQQDAHKAAEIIGYASLDFCGFPDNRMDGMDFLDIVK